MKDKKGQKRTKRDSFDIVGGNKVLITKSGRVDYEGQKRTKRDKKGQQRTVLALKGEK